jgi:peptidyl-prolyl cis-trans isomerase B (cyclophilin B)
MKFTNLFQLSLLPLALLLAGCDPAPVANGEISNSSVKENYSSTGTAATSSDESKAPETAPVPAEQPGSDMIEPKFEKPKDGDEVAVISTKFGKIVYKFRNDLAPKHVENFKKLANKGFYDKTIFHRVIPGFMIQGGDPNTKDVKNVESYGMGGPGYGVKAEFNRLFHRRGVVSMARSSDPDSAGSQFFVCVADAESLNKQYSAFGEVVDGMDVADKIVGQTRNAKDMPNERIEMTVKIAKWPVK